MSKDERRQLSERKSKVEIRQHLLDLFLRKPEFREPVGRRKSERGEKIRYICARYVEYCIFSNSNGQLIIGSPMNETGQKLCESLCIEELVEEQNRDNWKGSIDFKRLEELLEVASGLRLIKMATSASGLGVLLRSYHRFSAANVDFLESYKYDYRSLNARLERSLSATRRELESSLDHPLSPYPSSLDKGYEGLYNELDMYAHLNLYRRFVRLIHGWHESTQTTMASEISELKLVLGVMLQECDEVQSLLNAFHFSEEQVWTPSLDLVIRTAYLKIERQLGDREIGQLLSSELVSSSFRTIVKEARRLIPQIRKHLDSHIGNNSNAPFSALIIASESRVPTLVEPRRVQPNYKGTRTRV